MSLNHPENKSKAEVIAEKLSLNNDEFPPVPQKECTDSLEKIMIFLSHKIRQPVAHILGLSNLLNKSGNTKMQLDKLISKMKQSAHSLDYLTRELTSIIYKKIARLKSKK